jgi:E3 ubiquitin-protein ligase DOA10
MPQGLEECLFTPKINNASALLEPRGCLQLSVGDQKQKDFRIAQLREQKRKEEMTEPFAPSLHDAPAHLREKKSHLRLLASPDDFLRRVAASRTEKDVNHEHQRQQKELVELEKCTFHPKIIGNAPTFVQHMAESYKTVKSLREKENQAEQLKRPKERPEWRS